MKLVYNHLTCMSVTIKVGENLKKHLRLIMAEMAVLETVQHPHIIRHLQVLTTVKYLYIVTEYVLGGNLYQLVKEEGRLQEKKAQKMFRQLVSAFRYCHDHGIIHQDLKPQNTLQDAEGNTELGDFGLDTRGGAGTVLQGCCGTKNYNAPELVLRGGYDGRKADKCVESGCAALFLTTKAGGSL